MTERTQVNIGVAIAIVVLAIVVAAFGLMIFAGVKYIKGV